MHVIERLIGLYDHGALSRRELVHALLMIRAPAVAVQPAATSVFRAHSLDHVKVITADVERSRRFYELLLGVKGGRPTSTGLGGQHVDFPSALGFISLEPPRPGERPGTIEHFSVRVDGYVPDLRAAVQRALPDAKVHVEKESGALFFVDPDGAWVQLARAPERR